jgi:oxygen-independent coproporphyrinogen-3 oxidase
VEEKREYIEVILKELDIYNAAGLASVPAGSIYFGGGTPLILDEDLLAAFVDGTLQRSRLANNPVVTLEASPAELTNSKLKDSLTGRKRLWIQRAALGEQSCVDRLEMGKRRQA